MAAVKRTPADDWFSKCIRMRTNWHCERCRSYSPEGLRMGLHCAHTVTRGNWAVRFDPRNCLSLCNGCHRLYDSDYDIKKKTFIKIRGEGAWNYIQRAKSNTELGRRMKREKVQIARHFQKEFERMDQLRIDGETGIIQIVRYA